MNYMQTAFKKARKMKPQELEDLRDLYYEYSIDEIIKLANQLIKEIKDKQEYLNKLIELIKYK